MKQLVMAVLMLVGLASIVQADWVTATVRVGSYPYALAVNPVTNKILRVGSIMRTLPFCGFPRIVRTFRNSGQVRSLDPWITRSLDHCAFCPFI